MHQYDQLSKHFYMFWKILQIQKIIELSSAIITYMIV